LSFKTATEDMETSEATEIIEGTRHEVKQPHKLLFWGLAVDEMHHFYHLKVMLNKPNFTELIYLPL